MFRRGFATTVDCATLGGTRFARGLTALLATCLGCGGLDADPGSGNQAAGVGAPTARAVGAGGKHGTTRRELLPSGGTRRPAPLGADPAGFDYPATLVGSSGNVTVYYDSSLGSQGLALAQQFLANAVGPYNDMQTFFGIAGGLVDVVIVPLGGNNDGGGGAYHYGCDFDSGGVLYLDATFAQPTSDPLQLEIGLFIAELSEAFMGPQGLGWGCGSSNGEGLSRYLAEHETATNTIPDVFLTSPSWVSAGFPDWVSSTEGSDGDYASIGPAVLYIYWMRSQGYTISQITQAGGATLAANYQTLTGRTTAYADLKAAVQAVPVRNDNPFPVADLLWQNPGSGEISTWLLSGPTVLGTEDLSWTCGGGCANDWKVVDTIADNTVLWDNAGSGQIGPWVFNDDGTVTSGSVYSWTCDAASGCSSTWKPIARIWYEGTCPSGFVCSPAAGLIWFNAGTGEVSTWKLIGDTVTGTQSLSWTCAGDCATTWQPMLAADFNNDGNSDLLWYNRSSGQLSAWLLDGNQNVTGTQEMSWTCDSGSGCASTWRLVGAADANRDGNVDLLWHNASSGQLSNWLLDGHGNVTGSPILSWTCDAASGCSSTWNALGYVQFP